jgi:hypothetical protein
VLPIFAAQTSSLQPVLTQQHLRCHDRHTCNPALSTTALRGLLPTPPVASGSQQSLQLPAWQAQDQQQQCQVAVDRPPSARDGVVRAGVLNAGSHQQQAGMEYRAPEAVPLLPHGPNGSDVQQPPQPQQAKPGKRNKLLTVCPFILGACCVCGCPGGAQHSSRRASGLATAAADRRLRLHRPAAPAPPAAAAPAGNEFCERLAYYGLATNLVTYLTHIMGVDAAAAAVQVWAVGGGPPATAAALPCTQAVGGDQPPPPHLSCADDCTAPAGHGV